MNLYDPSLRKNLESILKMDENKHKINWPEDIRGIKFDKPLYLELPSDYEFLSDYDAVEIKCKKYRSIDEDWIVSMNDI